MSDFKVRGWQLAGMFDDFAQCPYCGQKEHPLMEAINWTYCPYCGEQVLEDVKENENNDIGGMD